MIRQLNVLDIHAILGENFDTQEQYFVSRAKCIHCQKEMERTHDYDDNEHWVCEDCRDGGEAEECNYCGDIVMYGKYNQSGICRCSQDDRV